MRIRYVKFFLSAFPKCASLLVLLQSLVVEEMKEVPKKPKKKGTASGPRR